VSLFGGAGSSICSSTPPHEAARAALEFGAAAAIESASRAARSTSWRDLFSLQRRIREQAAGDLAGYIRLGGSLSVLGPCISRSSSTHLRLPGRRQGLRQATLTVQVEVAFFHTSVDLTVERTFAA